MMEEKEGRLQSLFNVDPTTSRPMCSIGLIDLSKVFAQITIGVRRFWPQLGIDVGYIFTVAEGNHCVATCWMLYFIIILMLTVVITQVF